MAGIGGSIKLTGESEYQRALKQIRMNLTEVSSEMKIVTASFDKSDKSVDALSSRNTVLNKKLAEQKEKVTILEKALSNSKKEYGENSEQSQKWQTELNKAKADVIKSTREIEKNDKAMDDLAKGSDKTTKEIKELGNQTEKSTGKFKGFLSGIGGVAKGITLGLAGAITGAVAGLTAITESSKEFTDNMTKLKVAAESGGYSVDLAKDSFRNLYGILGDETAANTTVSNFMAMETSTENLKSLLNSSAGIWAKYGDSIPLDGLAESVNETSRVGKITGNLADALNWAGINEDKFNEQLAACSTEQERQQLVVDTLNKEYGKLGEEYQKNNSAMISLNEAQMKIKESMSEIGTAFSPILAILTDFGANVLSNLIPYVKEFANVLSQISAGSLSVSDGLLKISDTIVNLATALLEKIPLFVENGMKITEGLLNGIQQSLPKIMPVVIKVVTTFVNGLIQMLPQILQMGITVLVELVKGIAQSLPTLIPTIVDAVMLMTETLIDNIDLIIDAGIELILGLADGLIAALPRLISKVPTIIEKLIQAFIRNYPKLAHAGVELIINLANGVVHSIPTVIRAAGQIFNAVWNGVKQLPSTMLSVGKDVVTGLWNGISGMGGWMWQKVRGFAGQIVTNIKNKLGIHSPSVVMDKEVGTNLALGVGQGFDRTMSEVSKTMTESIPRKFDTKVETNSIKNESEYRNNSGVLEFFKEALKGVAIVLDDEVAGKFVEKTVTDIIYT